MPKNNIKNESMNEDFYINLIYKKLDNSISQKEEDELSSWLKADDQNQLTYDSVLLAWNNTELRSDPQFDLDDAFSRVEAKMSSYEESKGGSSTKKLNVGIAKNKWLQFSSMAATLLLVLAIAIKFIFPSNGTNWVEVIAETNLQEINLPDKSTVFLRKNSVLKYSSDYNNSRKCSLKGEGFFKVTSNVNNTFEVTTDHGTIRVLGTSFNIESLVEKTVVGVKTGKVSVSNLKDENVVLTKGQGVVLSNSKDDIGYIQTLIYDEIDWRDRFLEFKDQTLSQVIGKISSVYAVKFKLADDIKKCPITVVFDDEPLDIIVESLSTMLSADIIKHNSNFYEIKNGGCEN